MSDKHTAPAKSTFSFFLPEDVKAELRADAKRLGISYSRIAQMAWRIYRKKRAAHEHCANVNDKRFR